MTPGDPTPHSPAPEPASPAPYPVQSEEAQALVRRRAFPLGLAGLICGAGALAWLLVTPVGVAHPPNIYAVNLSFCAMLMGIGIIFYARRTPGTRLAVAASALALLTGFLGPLAYTKQTLDFKAATEVGEIHNVQAIANAARAYADQHGGNYPPDMATLLDEHLISRDQLRSPYETGRIDWPAGFKSHADLEKFVEAHAQYQYLGAGLRIPQNLAAQPAKQQSLDSILSQILIITKRDPIERKEITVGFADGSVKFVPGEDWEATREKSNTARRTLGSPAIQVPSHMTSIPSGNNP